MKRLIIASLVAVTSTFLVTAGAQALSQSEIMAAKKRACKNWIDVGTYKNMGECMTRWTSQTAKSCNAVKRDNPDWFNANFASVGECVSSMKGN